MYSLPRRHFFGSLVFLGAILTLFIYNCRIFYIDVYDLPTSTKINSGSRERPIKYILQWPDKLLSPFNWLGEGNTSFITNRCVYRNCFVTDDKHYFIGQPDKSFDAIVFNGRRVMDLEPNEMTSKRLPHQKYIFGIMESSANFPLCNKRLDGFFNWTWTYKLDSDFRWGYFTIYDLNGTVVGPKTEMHWMEPMEPIDDELKNKLYNKTKAAAWFVSNCHAKSGRENFADQVHEELRKYGWSVDIYGRCGDYECPKSDPIICYKMIEKDYYFYFAFENSFAEDYVTEKLMTALNNYAVPVVFGGANYSRFLPKGSYLDGRILGPEYLAKEMNDIINNKTRYYDFFRWRNHYVYKETSSNVDICNLCAMLNEDDKVHQTTAWKNFRPWWNGEDFIQNCVNRLALG